MSPSAQARLALLRNPVHCFSLGGGLGLLPLAPGSWGTLPGFVLVIGLRLIQPVQYAWLLLLLLFLLGVWCAGQTARALGVQDPAAVVCDEYLAFAGLLLALPVGRVMALWAFLLFRLFDAVKPFPVGWADRHVHGGPGIMLDDLLAAMLAWLAMQALIWLALPGGP